MKKTLSFVSALGMVLVPQAIFAYSYSGWYPNNDYNLPDATIYKIVENILMWLLAILGIAGVLGFVISGIFYLISAGDDDMIDRAKSAMKYSIYGVIVGLLGFVVIQAVNSMLNARNRF